MSIEPAIKRALEKGRDQFKDDAKFRALEDYYREMQKRGWVKQPEYTIPPIDTAGRRRFQAHTPKGPR